MWAIYFLIKGEDMKLFSLELRFSRQKCWLRNLIFDNIKILLTKLAKLVQRERQREKNGCHINRQIDRVRNLDREMTYYCINQDEAHYPKVPLRYNRHHRI